MQFTVAFHPSAAGIYAGGLGFLASSLLRSACNEKLPVFGIGVGDGLVPPARIVSNGTSRQASI